MKLPITRRTASLAAVSAAVLVPLGVLGAPALARSAAAAAQYQYGGSAEHQYKVQVCHRTHSKKHPWHAITISSAAVPAHLKHGDMLAPPCPPTAAAAAPQPAHAVSTSGTPTSGTSTTTDAGKTEHGNGNAGSHGNSGDHGNSGNHGNSGSSGSSGNSGTHGNGNGHGK